MPDPTNEAKNSTNEPKPASSASAVTASGSASSTSASSDAKASDSDVNLPRVNTPEPNATAVNRARKKRHRKKRASSLVIRHTADITDLMRRERGTTSGETFEEVNHSVRQNIQPSSSEETAREQMKSLRIISATSKKGVSIAPEVETIEYENDVLSVYSKSSQTNSKMSIEEVGGEGAKCVKNAIAPPPISGLAQLHTIKQLKTLEDLGKLAVAVTDPDFFELSHAENIKIEGRREAVCQRGEEEMAFINMLIDDVTMQFDVADQSQWALRFAMEKARGGASPRLRIELTRRDGPAAS